MKRYIVAVKRVKKLIFSVSEIDPIVQFCLRKHLSVASWPLLEKERELSWPLFEHHVQAQFWLPLAHPPLPTRNFPAAIHHQAQAQNRKVNLVHSNSKRETGNLNLLVSTSPHPAMLWISNVQPRANFFMNTNQIQITIKKCLKHLAVLINYRNTLQTDTI